ncbi:unnamed protein product [Hymenolepis diminuta]|uniref:17S U2 SnRNP complex component HTATSF1 n=1 Tax=Hymenolepis diminuta TaxID=6216 RepID=A0A0R3SE18_HYMDI|nr:unnamed protein product [Hymenolepis diminuta]VUZ46555.1 unnamed protein product [Hymenolepis diminuta]
MSSAIKESNEEFEDQFRLQEEAAKREAAAAKSTKKTRVDADGTVMEWDEEKRAWFPKIDDDFIASYQMSFGVQNEQESAHTAWRQFAAQIELLKAERGSDDEDVKKGLASLDTYYRSDAYRVWYEGYQKQQEEAKLEEQKRLERTRKVPQVEVSADDALKRAEEEQKLGVPISKPTEIAEQAHKEGNSNDTEDKPVEPPVKKEKKGPPEWYEISDNKNTHVYVSGLPPTITEAEFVALMSKCGIIMSDPLTDKLRIKLYRDEEGKPKGDGRCCYIKIESVDLALNILDGMHYEPGYVLHVERAKFHPKKDFDYTKHRRLTTKEKREFKQKQENLFKWKPEANKHIRSKKERVVILRDVFDETDLGLDVSLIPDVRERVRIQCAKVGVVKKIVVHDTNPEGVVAVTFSTPEEADIAISFLNGALFTYPAPNTDRSRTSSAELRRRQLRVERWDGRERFDIHGESAEEEARRLARWNEFLGGGGDDSEQDEDSDGGEGNNSNAEGDLDLIAEQEDVKATDTDEELEARGGVDSGAETE